MKINFGKILLSIFFISIGFLVIIGLGHLKSDKSIQEGYLKSMSANFKQEGELEECRRYNPFMAAREKIGKIAWTEEYNCLDHVKDMVKEWEKVGIKSVILINQDRSHSVAAVLIDYDGHFMSPDEIFEILEIRNSNMEVIYHK